jgi:predicted membrane metal-binding protein
MAGHFRQKMQEALAAGQPISSEDRTHAAAAHLLGAVVGVFTAGLLLPVLATTLVLVINKSRNPYVLFHVNQAAWFQVVSSVAIAVGGLLFLVIYFVTCGAGLLLLPLLLVPWLLSVLLPVWVAIGAQRGEWLGYPWLGDWVLDQESPFVDD